MKRRILISVSDGMVERNLLKTDFFSTLLSSDLDVHILSSNHSFFSYLSKEYAGRASVHYVPYSISKFDAVLTYFSRNSIASATVKEEQYSAVRGINGANKISLFVYLCFRIFWYLGHLRIWRSFLRFLFLAKHNNFAKELLYSLKPDLVFVASINPSDYKLALQSCKIGIKTIQMIKSWDNLSSKTFLSVLPDFLVVHNKIMLEEAVKYDDMPRSKIFVSGIPQFDYLITHRKKLQKEREAFYDSLGIDSQKKVILFSASGDRISPDEEDYLLMLEKAIEQGVLPSNVHIHVRLHPKYHTTLTRLNSSRHITLDRPFTYLNKLAFRDWIFEEKDMIHWYNSLYHAAVVINVASTMAIDAAVFDRPIISIGFDGYANRPYPESVLRYYARTHYVPVIETKAIDLVKNEQEFLEMIRQALLQPERKKAERQKLVDQQCYRLDGNASKRLADFILLNV